MIVSKLRYSREELDLKQLDVAKDLNVHSSTVSGWETGKDTIPLEQLIKYANLYKFTLDYLFGIDKRNRDFKEIKIDLNIRKKFKKIKKN